MTCFCVSCFLFLYVSVLCNWSCSLRWLSKKYFYQKWILKIQDDANDQAQILLPLKYKGQNSKDVHFSSILNYATKQHLYSNLKNRGHCSCVYVVFPFIIWHEMTKARPECMFLFHVQVYRLFTLCMKITNCSFV